MAVVTVLEMVEEEAGFELLSGCGREEVAAPEMVNKEKKTQTGPSAMLMQF